MWFWTCRRFTALCSWTAPWVTQEMPLKWSPIEAPPPPVWTQWQVGGWGGVQYGEGNLQIQRWVELGQKPNNWTSQFTQSFTLHLLQEPFCDFFGPLGVNRLVNQLSRPWELIGERKGTRWFWGWVVIRSVDADPPWLTNTPPFPAPPAVTASAPRTLPFTNLKGSNYRQVITNPTTLIRTLNTRMTEVYPDLHQAGIQQTTLLKATLSSWQLATV